MSDVDPTPDTPITVGDRLGWFRGDMGAKLDTVVSKLDTIIGQLSDLLAVPVGNNDDVVAAIGNIISRLDIAQTMGGSRNILLTDIRNAIGDISTYPSNYTVRRLLAMLQTSLDIVPADYAGNDPPDNTYTCGPWTRQTGWDIAGQHEWGGQLYDWYIPVFSGLSTLPIPLMSETVLAGFQMIRAASGGCHVCFSYNLIGDSVECKHIYWDTFLSNAYPVVHYHPPTVWPQFAGEYPIDAMSRYTSKFGGGGGAIDLGDNVASLVRIQWPNSTPPTALNYFISSSGAAS
jgi:hypothetical protein